ncbi:general odorant-binding protein 99a-like [Condylostylus longicornis]|uniref:general odorant-binding protein 99a-like n=1 Tax=Condylostylus longicornis TaxID=2530218 RepID=UPI00244DAB1C|nr:general odorant-binding protein 99a-like [Condylostylus longicornis]XP_055383663.1 general odorant-binding protein 99a-like [Condylostylus longicornis]
MKYCIIFLLFVGIASARLHGYVKRTVEQLKEARADCIEKFPVPAETRELFKKFEYPEEEIVENYVHCVAVELQYFVDTEGYIDEHLEKQFGNDKIDIINKCITFKKDHPDWTLGHWALSDWKCLVKEGLITEEYKTAILEH